MRGQPERVLVVIPSPEFGGAERQTLQVARGLARQGAEVRIVADAALIPAIARLAEGLTRHAIPIGFDARGAPAAVHARQAQALGPLLRAARPDVALVCAALPNEALGVARALHDAAIPMLTMVHLVRRDASLGATDHAALAGLRIGWAAVSAPAARRLETLLGVPVAVVPNGLPPAMPSPRVVRTGPPILLSVGRLDERKGAHLAPAIAAAIAPGRLIWAGTGPLANLMREVELPGHVADVPALLARADAFLLASEHEGCPLSVLEAAQAGCPILATRQALEAWPEAEDIARLVRRDPDHIAAVFAEALRDAEGTAHRVAHARAIVEAWDEAAMIRRTAWLLAAETLRCG